PRGRFHDRGPHRRGRPLAHHARRGDPGGKDFRVLRNRMTSIPGHRRFGSWITWGTGIAVAILLAYLAITCFQIISLASRAAPPRPADALVVFGAAQYAGRPSPVYRARLDHAFDLFRLGVAPVIITTGGAGGDPSFSEGGVGRDYLM